MEKTEIIKSISNRTGGDLYLGVVGAVRTGKSTFINHLVKKKIAVVGNKPGVTKNLSWIRVNDKTATGGWF